MSAKIRNSFIKLGIGFALLGVLGIGCRKAGFQAAFLTPITFYGQVVDQSDQPVAEANVKLSANDKIAGRPSEYLRKTDPAGRFSITGISGLTLAVEVSKEGYRVIPADVSPPTSSGVFDYGVGTHPHQPDANAPVIFRLLKIGAIEPLVKIGEADYPVDRNGRALQISLDGKGGHQVVLRCWNKDLQRAPDQRQYDWRLEVSVPNGGLVKGKGALGFEAPDDGYVPSDTVDMPASLPRNQWRDFAKRSYFVRFDDRTFARVNLEMQAGGDHFVIWESYYNPKVGSRNLESTPGR